MVRSIQSQVMEVIPTNSRDINKKREDYLSWSDYFMSMAFLAAKRSKDPVTQVGACVVNDENKIVGIGYNGMPIGCSDDEFPWAKGDRRDLDNKYLYVCHAEMNAILNKNAKDVKNCTIYVALFPCNECAKIITQSGIKEVVYLSDKYAGKVETIASKRMFDAAGIVYRLLSPTQPSLVTYATTALFWQVLMVSLSLIWVAFVYRNMIPHSILPSGKKTKVCSRRKEARTNFKLGNKKSRRWKSSVT